MNYFICTNQDGKLTVLDSYTDEDRAIKKLKRFVKKKKCEAEIIPVPDLKVGCRIFCKDGSYYGTITYETNNLWGISAEDEKEDMPDPYAKKRMEQWILSQNLIVVDGEDVSKLEEMMDKMTVLNDRVKEVLKDLEHAFQEQITMF